MTIGSTDFERAFEAVFLDFLDACFRPEARDANTVRQLCRAFPDASVGQDLVEETDEILRHLGPGPLNELCHDLRRAMRSTTARYDEFGFHDFVDRHFRIEPMESLLTSNARDFVYTKINHGFWEHLFSIFSDRIDPQRMRITEVEIYQRHYVGSSLLVPLARLVWASAAPTTDEVAFAPIHFALSLGNGRETHPENLRDFDAMTTNVRLLTSGAAIGAAAFFGALFGDRRIHADDGCFPKRGFTTGVLEEVLRARLALSDRVVCVVPAHLDGLQLKMSDLPHESLVISRTHVHEGWLATLRTVARPLLERMWRGENLMAIAQAGVFATILALFLVQAKRRLGLDGVRLDFFDLGQVVDVANPDDTGTWVRNHKPRLEHLFGLAARRPSVNT